MSAATLTFARSNGRPRRFAFDGVLLMTVAGILLLGLVMMTSASISIADKQLQDPLYFLFRQLTGVAFGVLAATVMMTVPTAVWERLAMPLLLVAFILLLLVLIPGIGHEVNGSRRWLRAGVMNFQASEMARVLLLTYLASYVVRRQAELKEELKGFLKPLGVLMGAAALLLMEPDFGAATVLMATGLGVLFLAGVKLRHFFALVAIAAAGMALIAVTSAYRLKRLTAFMDPWADPFNSGFQLTQSLIAIGRGELFGVGLGSSVQKLFYLPEAHTDFVFAVLAEELGLMGVILTLALFVVLVWRSFHISRMAAEAGLAFQAYCAAAFGIWLALQTFINVGVNMGILPTKGLTLPLMSYGGSSVMVTLGWLGFLMRIHHEASTSGRLAVSRPSSGTAQRRPSRREREEDDE
ncbi:putative lipid II flippase FtsW [Steroidobacter sp. S1-65]|uniref:Probable peptidoglycan glycosyltransferase FtsW n=1 Tax=Steroidobacter gossypii TaxID=2805490 RepID=A0ABS1X2Q3_9GAMM|nr:putative lipid II flippase FtsW [Steroidobacter gossypii]MBM0107503.1 putative lipid II flippase FtsW [Steroidobacter gossypii]